MYGYERIYLPVYEYTYSNHGVFRPGHGYQAGRMVKLHRHINSQFQFLQSMDYVVIERIAFDAILAQIDECAGAIRILLKMITPRSLDDWVDNTVAKSMLKLGTRSLQTMRSSGRIGYSIVDGKVFYPVNEIDRVLTQSYKKDG